MLDKELWQKYRIKKLSLKEKSIVIVITWMNSSEFFLCSNSDKCDKNIASVFKRQRKNGRIKIFDSVQHKGKVHLF